MAERRALSDDRAPRASRAQIRRRRAVALAALAIAALVVVFAVRAALPHLHRHRAAPPPPPPPPKPFRVVFPEGFTRADMAQRVSAVALIAKRKRGAPVRLSRATYLAATRRLVVPCFTPRVRTKLEGFLFPATYDFLAKTTSRAARARPDRRRSAATGARVEARLRPLEEPDAVRRPHDRVDGREGGAGSGGAPARRRGHLQPAARTHAARHRRDAALRPAHPADPVDPRVPAAQLDARTTRATASACRRRRSRTRGSRRSERPRIRRRSTTSTSCASPTSCTTSSPRAPRPSTSTLRARLRMLTAVALLGHPVAALAVARGCRTPRSPRSASSGLRRVRRRGRRSRPCTRSRTLGFAGANVTIPHKRAVVALCDEADGDAVNTLVFRDGRVLGFNTDAEILAGIDAHARLPDRRRRRRPDAVAGAAGGHARLLAPRRLAARRRRLRPDRERDADPRRGARSSPSRDRWSSTWPTGRRRRRW